MHYWGFSEPHALLRVFRTPSIKGVFGTPDINGGFRKPRVLTGVFETPGKLRYFQELLKTPSNPLATLALPGKFQTLGKTISGG